MGRPERAINGQDGAAAEFAVALRTLRQNAGSPSYRSMSVATHFSPATLARAASGKTLPSLQVALAYAQACGADRAEWEQRWIDARARLGADVRISRAQTGTEVTSGPGRQQNDETSDAAADSDEVAPRKTRRVSVRLVVAVTAVVALTAVSLTIHRVVRRAVPASAQARSFAPVIGGGPFIYDETTGPGCDMVFKAGEQEHVASLAIDNSDDMSHAWQQTRSVETTWSIPNCTNIILYSQPSTESDTHAWQNSVVWKFSGVPSNVPCTFHIYIPKSPLSEYDATYDWTNGDVVNDWIDENEFTINQREYAGSWYSSAVHEYGTGKAHLMLNDQRGQNPESAKEPLTASEVRLTCSG